MGQGPVHSFRDHKENGFAKEYSEQNNVTSMYTGNRDIALEKDSFRAQNE